MDDGGAVRDALLVREAESNREPSEMDYPFPGMDPYLEHAVLWESVHARLIVAIANQLQPRLDPRHVVSIAERVFNEGPQRRIPNAWGSRSHPGVLENKGVFDLRHL
jgi:hypothetical protein